MSVSGKKFRHICMASAKKAGQLKLLEDTLFMLRKPHAHDMSIQTRLCRA